MPVIDRRDQSGFTMLATTFAMAAIMLLAVVTVAAVNGDTNLSRRDLDQKRAFEAAKAGIDDFAYHLSANSAYWSECTNHGAERNAINQQGSTARQLPVPGGTGATYAIELIPATGHTSCDPATAATAAESMIQSTELPGSFRIRATGFAREAQASLTATFKPPSFLDYVYFTQRETLDPISYGYPNPSPELTAAYAQCSLTWQQGRYAKKFKVLNPETGRYEEEECSKISFATGDVIKGPLHTNDAISINGTPTFGRSSQDLIEVGAESPGWYALNTGSKPNFVGTFVTKAPILIPPASNAQLATIAQPTFRFIGQVHICLSGSSMTVGNDGTCNGVYSGPIPSNGVVYVSNGACEEVYSPFTAVYPETSGCGNAYVKGSYTGQLTIAAQNDVIINGSLVRTNESGLLGLIANNFVRLYHPCSSRSGNGAGSLVSPTIDAAILTIEHSIIVDHYDCGSPLGTLNVEGALAQKFRGPVGTGSASAPQTGYLKNYVYDNRLKYQEPPSFIEPKPGNWVIGRETLG